jgi:hypothetical protein
MGAFDDYQSPGQQGGVFSDYQPPAAGQGAQTQDLGSTALWNKPANASWSDYVLAHLTKPFQGAPQAASDYARVAANTFGFGDRALAHLNTYGAAPTLFPGFSSWGGAGGPSNDLQANLAAEHAKTAAANERLGPLMGTVANAVGYAPFGALGIAGEGGVLGTALEGGAAGAVAGAGQGDNLSDAAKGAAVGAVGGAGAGALTKYVVNPLATWGANKIGKAIGALSDPATVTASTAAAEKAAYAPAKGIRFDAFADVNPAYYNAFNSLEEDQRRNLSGAFSGKVQGHISANNQAGTVTASNIDGFGRDLSNAASTPADSVLAARIKQNLDGVLGNATPLTGQAPGDALNVIQNARQAHQAAANADALQKMSQNLSGFGSSPAGQAKSIAQQFYQDPSSPQYQALSKIATTAGGGGQTAYNLMHMIDPVLGFFGASVGGGPGEIAGEIAGHAMKPTIGEALSTLQQGRVARAIGGAYPALTGAPPTLLSPDVGPAIRALLLGKAAGSGY